MKRFAKVALAVTMIASLFLAGCGGSSVSSTVGSGNPSKVLTIASGNDIVSFDIHNHNNTSTEAVHVNMFDYLLKNDKDQKKVPALATSWEKKDDKTWQFKLREGVKFHNGDPFTAADVKFTLERVANDKKLLEYGNYKQIKEVKIIDDHTVDIMTYEPDPVLLNRLSRIGSGMLPSKYIKEKGWDEFQKNPVGTGPYKFSNWVKDDRLELVKNPDYFGEKAKWDKLVFRVIPEDSTRVSELLTGGVDIAVNIPPSDMQRIVDNSKTYTAQSATQRVMQLTLRTKDAVTANPKVREAIDLAIDKKAIVDNILGGAGTPTRTRVTPGNFGANPDLYNTSEYNPQKAKDLLKEAGYPTGLELTLSSPSGRYLKDKETAEMIASMLGEVGIKTKLELLEWSKFNEQYRSKKFPGMFMIAYGNSMFDAALAFDRLRAEIAKGETDYNNPEVEKLLKDAEKNMNAQEREQQYKKAQEIVANDRPVIYMFQQKSNYGVNKRIDFKPRLDEMFYADEISLK